MCNLYRVCITPLPRGEREGGKSKNMVEDGEKNREAREKDQEEGGEGERDKEARMKEGRSKGGWGRRKSKDTRMKEERS